MLDITANPNDALLNRKGEGVEILAWEPVTADDPQGTRVIDVKLNAFGGLASTRHEMTVRMTPAQARDLAVRIMQLVV